MEENTQEPFQLPGMGNRAIAGKGTLQTLSRHVALTPVDPEGLRSVPEVRRPQPCVLVSLSSCTVQYSFGTVAPSFAESSGVPSGLFMHALRKPLFKL